MVDKRMIDYIITFFSGGIFGGIVVYFLRTLYEHYLALSRSIEVIRIQEINKGAAAIRSAFAPALATLYLAKKHGDYPADEVPPFNVDSFLKEALLGQAAAIEVFRPHVSEGKRAAYQEAWEKYRHEVWNYGFQAEEFRTDIDDPWKIFEDLIHDILQFADEA